MICPTKECGVPIPNHIRFCTNCSADVGFPNVRAAQDHAETAALQARCETARVSAKAGKYDLMLQQFVQAIRGSKAVINRDIGRAQLLLSNDNVLYNTFYQEVQSQARVPANNPFDHGRASVDSALFPLYHEEIRFAALSLDGKGLPKYGALTMILKEGIIKDRATVFEENSMVFCARHQVVAGSPIPPGYRAVWIERHLLAEAKLYFELTPSTTPNQFPQILLQEGAGSADDNFIEVHIHGSFGRHGLERVTCPLPIKKADQAILKSLQSKLKKINVPVEIT